MSAHREPIRRIGTERILLMGVPRAWYTKYIFIPVTYFNWSQDKVAGLVGALIVYAMCHTAASIAARFDPYALEILLRAWHRRRVYQA
ncbi:hypothetical protein [Elstera sp.]|jgi:type IV secretory pathway TrbD component|uniref:hypothetical protein n=1 Tax=Elstera sp. TaxID=1916664 RepID=UPI0037C02CF4